MTDGLRNTPVVVLGQTLKIRLAESLKSDQRSHLCKKMQRKDGTVAINFDESVVKSNTNGKNGPVPKLEPKKSRLKSLIHSLIFLLHTAIVFVYGFSVWQDWIYYTPLLHDFELIDEDLIVFFQGYLYKLVYLGNIYHLLQLFYFFWCCVTDLISASASETSVGKVAVAVRDWFLAAVVFPIGTLVVTTFWAIYAVDRELIFPEALDKFFPSWLNHALHTYVLPLLLVDMLLVNHKYPSRRAGMAGTLAFGLSYLIWILFLGFAKDIWVYPFFKVLHGVYFPIFFATMSLILIMFYIIGEKTNALLGGYKKEVSTEKID